MKDLKDSPQAHASSWINRIPQTLTDAQQECRGGKNDWMFVLARINISDPSLESEVTLNRDLYDRKGMQILLIH